MVVTPTLLLLFISQNTYEGGLLCCKGQHVGFWRYFSIACAYFTTITKGSFSNSIPSTCSYRAMRISGDTIVGSSVVGINVLRSKNPSQRRIRSEGRTSPTLCQTITLAPWAWKFTIKHPKCLLKVFGGSRVNLSCSSSMTCTIAKYLLNKFFTEHDM